MYTLVYFDMAWSRTWALQLPTCIIQTALYQDSDTVTSRPCAFNWLLLGMVSSKGSAGILLSFLSGHSCRPSWSNPAFWALSPCCRREREPANPTHCLHRPCNCGFFMLWWQGLGRRGIANSSNTVNNFKFSFEVVSHVILQSLPAEALG